MFLSSYVHSLDSKNRLTIPAKYRDQLAVGLVVTAHPLDPYLLLFPQARWEQLAEKIDQSAVFDPSTAVLRRQLFSFAEDLKPDGQGRIVISQRLRALADIQADVLIAGANTFVELWNPALWEQRVEQPRRNGEIKPDMFADLKI
jgi:MraZ protein